jgi:hypothetical protein
MRVIPEKPLGYKSYGSIPHLPGSRRGPGDHGLSDQQARILTEKVRDRHDVVIVTEKLDGSNVCVARQNGKLIALGRSGYRAESSPYEQHQLFAAWVRRYPEYFDWLKDGCRVCGEWMIQAHGTRYSFDCPPFSPFDVMQGQVRMPLESWVLKTGKLTETHILHIGGACGIDTALELLGDHGFCCADKSEGCVWRVERKGQCDFLGKFVRPDKVDGYLLPEQSGKEAVWNVDIKKFKADLRDETSGVWDHMQNVGP